MSNIVTSKLKETKYAENMNTMCGALSWSVAEDEALDWAKCIVAGIMDVLNEKKSKAQPQAVLVQDLKGNKIIYACVEYIPKESEEGTGSWSCYWSWDCESIPENAVVHTLEKADVQTIIRKRGGEICGLVLADKANTITMAVYFFNIIRDMLDQQAVEDGGSWTIEEDGYFEATVEVVDGVKQYSFTPKGEMKMLIKADDELEEDVQ